MRLIGSQTSPYVRRIRILATHWKQDIEFQKVDLFTEEGQMLVATYGPLRLIPILTDDNVTLSHSRTIAEYLREKAGLTKIDWVHQELITVIDQVNDILIQSLIMKRADLQIDSNNKYFANKDKRVSDGLQYLEEHLNQCYDVVVETFLFCLLDWVEFRSMWDLSPYPQLASWLQSRRDQEIYRESDPRKA